VSRSAGRPRATHPEGRAQAGDAGIYEDGEEIVGRAELAGVESKEEKRENYHHVELSYGMFTRGFSLPASIYVEKIRAESKHGVLLVRLPKKPEAKPRSIQVKVS